MLYFYFIPYLYSKEFHYSKGIHVSMNSDIVSWRSIVGCFCLVKALSRMINKYNLLTFAFKHFMMCLLHIVNCVFMMVSYLTFEGPGPFRNLLNCMHWNLNSLVTHDGIRIPIIQSYNLLHNYDLIVIT